MGRIYDGIDQRLATWLEGQPVFFVGTAPLSAEGHINVSPKGNRKELAVLGQYEVAYLDQTGSGIETVAHLGENGRIIVMACAFSGPPRIVRIHGRGEAVTPGNPGWDELASKLEAKGADSSATGVRCIIRIAVERVADSCGYGVPLMSFERHRDALDKSADRKGLDGIAAYQQEKNTHSIDGLPGLPARAPAVH